jgi:hypothetical protein
MKHIILLNALIYFFGNGIAQMQPIKMTSNLNGNTGYTLDAENFSYANYTLRVNFITLQGYNSTLQDKTFTNIAPHGKMQVARLTKDGSSIYSLNYNYTYFIGTALRRMPDTNFVYLLPSTPGNIIRVNKAGSINERLGIKEENPFYSSGFTLHLGDTVCAVRAGIVIELLDRTKEGDKQNQVYNVNRNKIRIEQKDGTIATYEFLSPIQSLIELGDRVNAGQPLAVLNKESDKYHLFVSVNYLDEKKLEAYYFKNNLDAKRDYYITLPVKFHIDQTTNTVINKIDAYTVEHPVNIIAEEMSKKDKKKLGL